MIAFAKLCCKTLKVYRSTKYKNIQKNLKKINENALSVSLENKTNSGAIQNIEKFQKKNFDRLVTRRNEGKENQEPAG